MKSQAIFGALLSVGVAALTLGAAFVPTSPLDLDGGGMDVSVCTNGGMDACAGNGNANCPGDPGTGGSGAQGGGAAIALYASGDASVSVLNGGFFAGYGGVGSPGGGGGSGNPGKDGLPGVPAACQGLCPSCTAYTIDGGAGAPGTLGGCGGQGGGGAGGPIYYYAAVNGATITLDGSTLALSQLVGEAGAGGSPNGLNGAAGIHP
jgi:hypothetical protein